MSNTPFVSLSKNCYPHCSVVAGFTVVLSWELCLDHNQTKLQTDNFREKSNYVSLSNDNTNIFTSVFICDPLLTN